MCFRRFKTNEGRHWTWEEPLQFVARRRRSKISDNTRMGSLSARKETFVDLPCVLKPDINSLNVFILGEILISGEHLVEGLPG